ncbi:MAG: hypothetical protein E7Z92_06930 [Cyanobacteria bacterium SIG31]|nr:hypothetical protein [Cyanobacteria bacterium SIG31]
MVNFKYIKAVLLLISCSVVLTGSNFADRVTAQPVNTPTVTVSAQSISPITIVSSPKNYLNQTVQMEAKFDKFSTLGLDYKPAFKSSEDYISFLIKRDDTQYDIPLSEMKLFLKRSEAEKHIDLKTNDEISIIGKVFSDALGDAWIEVEKLTLVKKAPEKDGVK